MLYVAKICRRVVIWSLRMLGRNRNATKRFQLGQNKQIGENAKMPKSTQHFWSFFHIKIVNEKQCVFCEKAEIQKYFSVIRIAKNRCKLYFFSFSQKNVFKSVHLTSPSLHKIPCRKLAALNWLPSCGWVGWGILLGVTATELTNRWPLALARGLQRSVHLKEWGREKMESWRIWLIWPFGPILPCRLEALFWDQFYDNMSCIIWLN